MSHEDCEAAIRPLTIFEGWLYVKEVSSCDHASKARGFAGSSNGHLSSSCSSHAHSHLNVQTAETVAANVTHTLQTCTINFPWTFRYCMFVSESRKFFCLTNERQKHHVIEQLQEDWNDCNDCRASPQYTRHRLDGGIERFANYWHVPLSRLTDNQNDREKIAFGEVLSRSSVDQGSNVPVHVKSLTLSGAPSSSSKSRKHSDCGTALKDSSRFTQFRRSLPHKFKQQRVVGRTSTELELCRDKRPATNFTAKLAESAEYLDRLDRADVDAEVRSVALFDQGRRSVKVQQHQQQAATGFKYFVGQLKQSFSLSKVYRKDSLDKSEAPLSRCSPYRMQSAASASCFDVGPSPIPTPTSDGSLKKSMKAKSKSSQYASTQSHSLGVASGMQQLREIERHRDFGPLLEQETANSLGVLPTPSDDASTPPDVEVDDDGETEAIEFVSARSCDAKGRCCASDRGSIGSTASSSATSTPTRARIAVPPAIALPTYVQSAGSAHASVLPTNCPYGLHLYANINESDELGLAPCRVFLIAVQSRDEQRNWLAAFRGRPPSQSPPSGDQREKDEVDSILTISGTNTIRVERTLRLSVMELRNVPRKKRYFCELFLDSLLHARTGSRLFDDDLLFCQLFDFSGLPPYAFAHVAVLREPSSAKRKNRLVSALSGSRCNKLVGRCSIELSKLLNLRGNGNAEFENWYSLEISPSSDTQKTPSQRKGSAELRVKVRYQVLEIMSRDCYDELVQLVCTDYVEIVALLEPYVSVRFKDELASAMVGLFHHLHLAQRFLVDVIVHDVRSLDDAEMTFRGNSVATKATEAYLKLIGHDYLHEILGSSIKDLLESNDDCEVDEQKIVSAASVDENRKRLEKWCSAVCERIGRSYERVPYELQGILSHLRTELVALGKSALVENLISSCIFLRFICPAILSPSLFGLVSDYPSRSMNRNLTLITKVVQTLANGTEFGAKESYMRCMNRFLVQNRSLLSEFVRRVSVESHPQPRSVPTVKNRSASDFDKELAAVHSLLADALVSLDDRCVCKLEENAAQRDLLARLRTVVSRITERLRQQSSSSRLAEVPSKKQPSTTRFGLYTQSMPSFTALQQQQQLPIRPTAITQLAANNGHVTAIAGLMDQQQKQQQQQQQRMRAAAPNVRDRWPQPIRSTRSDATCARVSVYDNVPQVSTNIGTHQQKPSLTGDIEADWSYIVREAEAVGWGFDTNAISDSTTTIASASINSLPQQDPSVIELHLRHSEQNLNESSAQLTVEQPVCFSVSAEPRVDLQAPSGEIRIPTSPGRIYATKSMPTVQRAGAEIEFDRYVLPASRVSPISALRIRDSTCRASPSSVLDESLGLIGSSSSTKTTITTACCNKAMVGRRSRLASAEDWQNSQSQSASTSGYQSLRSEHSDSKQAASTLAQQQQLMHVTASSTGSVCRKYSGTSQSSVHRAVTLIQPQVQAQPHSQSNYSTSCSHMPASLTESSPPPGRHSPSSYFTLVDIVASANSAPSSNRSGSPALAGSQSPQTDRARPVPPPSTSPLTLAPDTILNTPSRPVAFRTQPTSSTASRTGVILPASAASAYSGSANRPLDVARQPQLNALAEQLENIRSQIQRLQSTDAATGQLLADLNSKTGEVLRFVTQQQQQQQQQQLVHRDNRTEMGSLAQQLSVFERSAHQFSQQYSAGVSDRSGSQQHTPIYRVGGMLRPMNRNLACFTTAAADDSPAGRLRDSVDLTLTQIRTILGDDSGSQASE